MSQHGFGAVDWRHHLAQNMQASAELWPKIDVALAVGTRFLMPMFDWGYDDKIKLIRVDPDAIQSIEPWKPDVHIVSTGKKALGFLAERASWHNRKRKSCEDELNGLKKKWPRISRNN
jgi:acetolactate synthase-1/2/3 large subunit